MNRGSTRTTDKNCNVCQSAVEIVGNAATQCSNRHCITRDRDNNLGTDASASEVAEYYQAKDTVECEEIDEHVRQAYREFKHADHHDKATAKNGAVKALLPLSSYSGWGDLKMEVEK